LATEWEKQPKLTGKEKWKRIKDATDPNNTTSKKNKRYHSYC
jgi:hypothetical protein